MSSSGDSRRCADLINLNATYQAEAEQIAAKLPPLMVAAERVAETVIQGLHGRRRTGQGEAFWQFRRYQPGDQAARIDWRQSARSQALFIRENEWEAAESVFLWRDSSQSMNYASTRRHATKRDRATLLTLALSACLLRGDERVALLDDPDPPRRGRAALVKLASQLVHSETTSKTAVELPKTRVPRYARLVLFSDFFMPVAALEESFAFYAGQGVKAHLVMILDPAETSLAFEGRVRFVGMEAEGSWLARRVADLRAPYRERLAAHRDKIAAIAAALGWSFAEHRTDQTPEAGLLGLYATLAGIAANGNISVVAAAPGSAR